jgi:hypothetical protein
VKILRQQDVNEWLVACRQPKDPYNHPELVASLFHEQFYTPKPHAHIEGVVRQFFDGVIGHGDLLVVVHDWSPWDDARFLS